MINIFLSLIISTIIFYPVGTVQQYQSSLFNYTIQLDKAEFIYQNPDEKYLRTHYIVKNFHDLDFSLSRFNFEAYDENGSKLKYIECTNELNLVLKKNEVGQGYLCWQNLQKNQNTFTIIYSHSLFEPSTFAWFINDE